MTSSKCVLRRGTRRLFFRLEDSLNVQIWKEPRSHLCCLRNNSFWRNRNYLALVLRHKSECFLNDRKIEWKCPEMFNVRLVWPAFDGLLFHCSLDSDLLIVLVVVYGFSVIKRQLSISSYQTPCRHKSSRRLTNLPRGFLPIEEVLRNNFRWSFIAFSKNIYMTMSSHGNRTVYAFLFTNEMCLCKR